jgi:protoporphyrinogen oxidase
MKIAIIGSGISALYLGYKLKNKGYDFDIYEKNNSIGGRIKVVDFEDIPVVAGAGILRFKKDKKGIIFKS